MSKARRLRDALLTSFNPFSREHRLGTSLTRSSFSVLIRAGWRGFAHAASF
jgi:hypothetical protein